MLGLIVNIASAFMLGGHHHHDHGHDHNHSHEHHHEHEHGHGHDHNLRAAYLHVIADALTSVLAIVALLAGKALGWVWLDPVMGIVGAVIITKWAIGLGKDTGAILLDRLNGEDTRDKIVTLVEEGTSDKVSDIHIWRLNSNKLSGIVSIVTHDPKTPDYYKGLIGGTVNIQHLTVEVQHCT